MSEGPPSSNPFAAATPEVSSETPKEQEASEPKSDPKIEALLKVWESPVKQKAFVEGIALKSGEQIDAIAHTVYEAAEQLREQGSKTEGQTEEQRNFFWAKFHVLMAIFNFLTTLSFKKTREKDDANKKQILKELEESELSGQKLALSRVLRHEEVADVFENPEEYFITSIPKFCQECISSGAAHEVVDHFASIKDPGDRRLVLHQLLDRAVDSQVEIFDWIGGVLAQCEDVDYGVAETLAKAKKGPAALENLSSFALPAPKNWDDLRYRLREGMSEEEIDEASLKSEKNLEEKRQKELKLIEDARKALLAQQIRERFPIASQEFRDSFLIAIEAMGEKDVIGPDKVGKALGVNFEDPPEIPFSKEELEKAKELKQFLILRYDKLPDGTPITSEEIRKRFTRTAYHDFISSNEYYLKNVPFDEMPRLGWALTSKHLIHKSSKKDYLQQTELLIDCLEKAFSGFSPQGFMPERYKIAISEFEKRKPELLAHMLTDMKEAAKQFSELEITQLTRRSMVEVLYDLNSIECINTERYDHLEWELLAQYRHEWTSSIDASGNLIVVTRHTPSRYDLPRREDIGGLSFYGRRPDSRDDQVCSSFSRRF